MNILVTGGYGFIGMYLTKDLVRDGHRVFVYDLLPGTPDGFEHVTGIRGDLLEINSLLDAVYTNRIEQIVNLAALRNNDSQNYPYKAFQINCMGFVNCLEATRIFKLERLVSASSVAVLGDFDYYRDNGYDADRIYALPEKCAKYPTNIYGVTKLFNEQLGEQYAAIYGMRVLCARLPLIFGSGKKDGSRTGVFNDMIIASYEGRPLSVKLRADRFNLIYVKDAAYGLYRAVVTQEAASGVYNICGATVDMYEYAAAIREIIPQAKLSIMTLNPIPVSINTCIDPALAKSGILYEPQFTLREGILDYLETMRL